MKAHDNQKPICFFFISKAFENLQAFVLLIDESLRNCNNCITFVHLKKTMLWKNYVGNKKPVIQSFIKVNC